MEQQAVVQEQQGRQRRHQPQIYYSRLLLATLPISLQIERRRTLEQVEVVEEANEGDKELEDEILKEILREDEERRKQREKAEADIKKRGGAKNKKKKKDKKNKEDL
jgi:hypothetical protein